MLFRKVAAKTKRQDLNKLETLIMRSPSQIHTHRHHQYDEDFEDFETSPIILSTSEDNIELDTSEIEIEKIASKYSKKRRIIRSKLLLMLVSILGIIVVISTFAFVHTAMAGRNKVYIKDKKVPTHPAFTHLKSQFVPGFQASMHLYRHTQTQAEFIAYTPIDKNQDKVFGISFRTKPTSNNGVAHILEHSVLSGSKKYPSKDPFLHLLKGSLHTYLNAMTYNDRTVYPIASRNKKDFFNLMSVYLDAVFFPNCVEESGLWILKQEGWRYDFVEDGDENGGNDDNYGEDSGEKHNQTKAEKMLQVTGVVYSEMKGVFSDPESVLSRYTDKYLYPDNTYHYDSGGEPESIPTLTQAEFVDFYKRHYHPTNSQIFISGNLDDIEASMELMDSEYLSKYTLNQKAKDDSQISFQKKKFVHHLYQSRPYSVAAEKPDEGQHLLMITWLLNDTPMKQLLELSFYVLDYLLIGTSSSPLYKMLTDSGLGSDVIGGGYGPGLMQSTFAVGMKGVKAVDVSKVEDTILNVFREIAKSGFKEDDLKAAINSIEFQLREVHTGTTPMGINVFLMILQKWNYDQDPYLALEYETALASLKKIMKKDGSGYFVSLIEDYILNNNHRVHMELRPSETLEQQKIDADKQNMQVLINRLSQSELASIQTQTDMLKKIQNNDDPPEIVQMIPSLAIGDLDRVGVEYPLEVQEKAFGSAATLVTHSIDGSPGIVYIDVGLDISSVPFADIGLLPLVKSILSECDTKSYSREELDRFIGIYTGGISTELLLLPVQDDNNEEGTFVKKTTKMRTYLFFHGKCTVENAAMMIELFKEIIENNVIVSQEKVMQMIERKISSYKSSISSSGNSYAVMRMHSRYDADSYIDERLYGVSQLNTLKSLLDKAKNNWDQFKVRLNSILRMHSPINAANTVINLTGDSAALIDVQSTIENFVASLESDQVAKKDTIDKIHPWIAVAQEKLEGSYPVRDEGIVISSQVSYVGKGGLVYEPGDEVSGSTCVPLQYLKKGYLWDEVRAKNGAYGVNAALGSTDGTLFMVSYRDPNLVKTLDVYDHAADYLLGQVEKKALTQTEITRAIIGCISSLDWTALPPKNAGWIAFTRYMSNSSAARRQHWRDGILDATQKDFSDFANRLKAWKNTSVAVVASDRVIKDAGQKSHVDFALVEAY